jgi:gamma-glutamyltranspeptidase/glutathione hydrolase
MARFLNGTARLSWGTSLADMDTGPGRCAWRWSGLPRRAALAGLALLTGCSSLNGATNAVLGSGVPQPGQAGYVRGFLGAVIADEPHAALAGREVLSEGGTAADAAVAVGLTLAVTLPSRADLGGGGACLAFQAGGRSVNKGMPEAVIFTPVAPAQVGPDADRPAAVPMLARGLYLLQARYGGGVIRFEQLAANAEQLARFGVPVSRAFARDLALVSGPLFADPAARAVFSHDGVPLSEGQIMVRPDLGSTLSQIRTAGVGDMYQGLLAQRIARVSPQIGGPLTLGDLRRALPKLAPPLVRGYGNDRVAFLPPPADGGLAAEAAFDALLRNPGDVAGAQAVSLAAVARYRAGGVSAAQVLETRDLPPAGATVFPASTSFVTLDRNGGAVACTLTMDNLFGTGRIFPGLGFLAAASPNAVPMPLLAAALAWNNNLRAFRAAVAGSGQEGAGTGVALAMLQVLKSKEPVKVSVPDPARVNLAACGHYLPGVNSSCYWENDPRNFGLALGAN